MAGRKISAKNTILIAIIGGILIAIILVLGTIWTVFSARKDAENAAHSVSILYLDELAGRREQVVAANLSNRISDLETALAMMEPEDYSDTVHLREYQAKMKRYFVLEKFAFVDSAGIIYTASGTQNNISEYSFDYTSLSAPEISIFNLENLNKKVVIAYPVNRINCEGHTLVVCFMEIDMDEMLRGVSMHSEEDANTFCNIYTSDGIALSNTVLGGLAAEDNLLEALRNAQFEEGYTYDKVLDDFSHARKGEVFFTYGGVQETLSYVPIDNTNWFLTYLIRESVITDTVGAISSGIVVRSILQFSLISVILVLMFVLILMQTRKNARLSLEKETSEVESRVKQQQMEEKLSLQEQLLEQEKLRSQQTKMITALSSDYYSVYYIELDKNEGECYQEHEDIDDSFKVGEHFDYEKSYRAYAEKYVTEKYRDEFIKFGSIQSIKEGLRDNRVISYRYTVFRHGRESYEMVRFAGVRHPEDRSDHLVHAVGACFTNVDEETRKSIVQSEMLSDALAAAEQASKAKTAFLSNMSHEIRTPMNTIIGLDNIALNDPDTPEKTKDYLTKIGASAEHLLHLINDILDMSRIESGRMSLRNEEFSLAKMLEYINTMFSGQCSEKGLEYNCRTYGHLDEYYIGDSIKLRQVLINILGNAVKFTNEGEIELTVDKIAQFDGKTTLRFKIKDSGIGMSEEFLPHIFDPFVQENSSTSNRYGSSGLGLAITKNIVEMMNGNIHVESEKGKGTLFTVVLTLLDSERSNDGESKEIKAEDMSVLVVDDDPIARENAKLVLGKAGIAAELAESGKEAIELVKLRHARRKPYNLILVDWKMPEMDGVETTRRIRSIVGNETAVIILTAYKWDEILSEAVEAGVDSFLSKPLFANNVIEEFKSALIRRESSAQKEKVDLNGKRVLVAEDVEINADILKMILGMRGIEMDYAQNGKIALDKFATSPVGHYDAILMDMRMPEMNGLDATKAIRKLSREDAKTIPIIALTANAFDEDVQRSLQAGLNAHLSKPIKPDALFDALESFISKK